MDMTPEELEAAKLGLQIIDDITDTAAKCAEFPELYTKEEIVNTLRRLIDVMDTVMEGTKLTLQGLDEIHNMTNPEG